MFLGKGPKGEILFEPPQGVQLDNLDVPIARSPLLTEEEEAFYTEEYDRHGMHYPLNWYRTRRINWEDEQELVTAGRIDISAPTLMVVPTKDDALPPWLSQNMGDFIKNLTWLEVPTHHWALVAAADEVNAHITSFLASI